MCFPRSLALRTATLIGLSLSLAIPSFASIDAPSLVDALRADYPLTKVGVVMLKFDYNRITAPGSVLIVRVPGIYADVANTPQAIISTNIDDGQAHQQTGFLATLSKTNRARTLATAEPVYVTRLDVRKDTVHFELLTQNVTTLADGESTRYRAEVNFHIPNLDSMTPDQVKAAIDAVIADPSIANAVQSKTIKLGMSPAEVKNALGNPINIVDMGEKQIYIYKDLKVVFKESIVTDVE